MRGPGTRVLLILLSGLGLLLGRGLPVRAIDLATLQLGSLAGEGWHAEGLRLELDPLEGDHARVLLRADALRLPGPEDAFSDLRLNCAAAEIDAGRIACADGKLQLDAGRYGRQTLRTAFHYRFEDGRLDFSLHDIRLLGGRVAVQGKSDADGWQIGIEATGVELVQFAAALAASGFPRLEGDGSLGLTADLQGAGSELAHVRYRLHLHSGGFSNADGSLAGEALEAVITGSARPVAAGWYLDLEAALNRGGLYIEPLYLEVPGRPIEASAQLEFHPRQRRLLLHSLAYRHPGTVALAARGRIEYDQQLMLRQLHVELQEGTRAALYGIYLRPWLTGTLPGDLEAGAGHIAGELHWQDGALARLRLELSGVAVHDRAGRFDLEGVSGRLRWSSDAPMQVSDLHWRSGSLYRVELGKADLLVEAGVRQARLLEPARLGILDGELQLDSFEIGLDEAGALRWAVDGILTPVSMQRLSLALGWPEFSGQLSGVIPAVRYADGVLGIGGVLLVRAFDGVITLNDVRLERPFGLVPRLQLDARLRDIDLEALTGAFSFGRIEGRIEGHIDDLVMESWRPVAFDAAIATPPGDRSRHRISQRAVDNISSIGGGGVGGALSRTLLRVFEDFPYDRLGISCRLENGVCEMGGIAPADGGYYLVKGRLLPPRLDVIGYAERVDWDLLVSQIMTVTSQQAAAAE